MSIHIRYQMYGHCLPRCLHNVCNNFGGYLGELSITFDTLKEDVLFVTELTEMLPLCIVIVKYHIK